jgi:cytidyltransferase-like protein
MALQKLREYFNETNRENFIGMLKNRVLVTEKIAAPSFHMQRTSSGFEFFKSSKSEALNIVDRTVISLYEIAINHLQSLTSSQKEELPKDFKFGFEYLPEENLSEIKYDKTPQNFLILTHIQEINTNNGKVRKNITDPTILNKWANILDVQGPSVIFDGYLNSVQKEELINILEMSDREFSEKYDYLEETSEKTSFTKKIIKLFNPSAVSSTLHEDLESPIDGLIVNFVEGKTINSFKLEDFNRTQILESRDSSDMYQITIIDLLEYLIAFDFSEIQLTEENADKRYIEIMSVLFNGYIDKNASKFVGVNFESAEFSSAKSFKLNTKYIQNEKTLKFVENEVLSELFKITLSTFKKKRTKTTDIINQDMLDRMNEVIETIQNMIYVENTDENAVFNYQNFMLHNKIKSSVNLNEALKLNHVEQGKELVNMFVGRFQPFTLGHAKVLESLYKENGYPVVVLLVKAKNAKPKKGDEFSKPYNTETQIEMFNNVKKQYKFLKDILIVPTGGIDTIFNALRPKYEPVLWGTGSDRMSSYGYQVNNDSYRDQLNCRADFRLFEIKRTDDNISATKVRNALLDGDKKLFQSMTPKAIHGMYDELKTKLETSMGVLAESNATEGIMTFEQFKNKL